MKAPQVLARVAVSTRPSLQAPGEAPRLVGCRDNSSTPSLTMQMAEASFDSCFELLLLRKPRWVAADGDLDRISATRMTRAANAAGPKVRSSVHVRKKDLGCVLDIGLPCRNF